MLLARESSREKLKLSRGQAEKRQPEERSQRWQLERRQQRLQQA